MRNRVTGIAACALAVGSLWGCVHGAQAQADKTGKSTETAKKLKVVKSDQEWKKLLTPEQYNILREQGTERAYTGKYWHNMDKGTYVCAACGQELFSSKTKFDSGTGWPSFYDVATKGDVIVHTDADGERTEVLCSRCGGHLGHVFNDGPQPTGLRYCMNSAAMNFHKEPVKAVVKTGQAKSSKK